MHAVPQLVFPENRSMSAFLALCQLSYIPVVGTIGLEPITSRLQGEVTAIYHIEKLKSKPPEYR